MNRTLSCEGYHSMRCNIVVQLHKPVTFLRELSYNSAKARNWSDRGNLTPHAFVHTIGRQGGGIIGSGTTGDAVVVLAEPYEGELLPSSPEVNDPEPGTETFTKEVADMPLSNWHEGTRRQSAARLPGNSSLTRSNNQIKSTWCLNRT